MRYLLSLYLLDDLNIMLAVLAILSVKPNYEGLENILQVCQTIICTPFKLILELKDTLWYSLKR